ncbi:MAG: thioesterase family protein [Vicinamibacterales bacterium]|nr:thioesterase family protein [Vicinamibacterales bacterium]
MQSCRTPLRVRYAETDQMQVVYYANYFVWFEFGRCEWLRSLGRSYRDLEATGIQLPVIEAHCQYRRSAQYDDDLTIVTRGHLLSPARVQFEYEVQRVPDNVVTAVGRTVHAAVNNTGRPTRLPVDVREMFA